MKILILDLETTPMLGWSWQSYNTNLISVEEDSRIMSAAYKWYGEKGAIKFVRPDLDDPYEDTWLIKHLWDLLDTCDVLVGHNAGRFDSRKMNAQFLRHKLPPPAPYRVVDTLKVARKHFNHSSNKLDSLVKVLGIDGKVQHGGFMKLFDGCMRKNDPKMWKLLERYNRRDIVLTEKLYKELLPWIDNHPMDPYKIHNHETCPNCHKTGTAQKRGFQMARTWSYQRYWCNPAKGGCSKWFKGRSALKSVHDAIDESPSKNQKKFS